MPSSESANPLSDTVEWRGVGLRYHSLSHYFRREFGCPVWKVSVDGGFTCPNVDGTVGTTGCIFCNVRAYSPSRPPIGGTSKYPNEWADLTSITEQIDEGVRRLRRRYGVDHFVAYFQPATNTYAPVRRLRGVWEEALRHPDIVGLIVGTRPDCVPDDVLDLLAEFGERTWLSLEYGLQTIHDRSLDWLGRGHRYGAFLDAVRRTRLRKLRIGAHVILGLPCETRDQMLTTARELARLRIDSVKLHNLYVAKDTPLAEMLATGKVALPDRQEYVSCVVDFLEELPPDCVVDRLSADAPRQYLVAPSWCRDKSAVRAAIEAELRRRNTWQGRKYGPAT